MITFMESKERSKEGERCLDSQLWHACAGSMVQMPAVNSKVFYFPQGHFEHVTGNSLDLWNCPRLPASVPCRVSAIQFMADPETDEVFAKIRLIPTAIAGNEVDLDRDGASEVVNGDKPSSFAKTLTQSDANNGGGFSVPRYCAETIFPRLDYSADPPVQTIIVKDVHGEVWKFRHIYRGTPRRHLLTTGWSTFVNHKKLVAGDSIVFSRSENGDLCVGIRRAKSGIGGAEATSHWNSSSSGGGRIPFGGFSMFFREGGERKSSRSGSSNGSLISRGRVKAEDVIEAATMAANGKGFEVIYYPRGSNPEFCVMATLVKAALKIRWCSGMRFKMAFETEDSSRISWFMGTVSSVMAADPVRWPDSPWRLLQVRWDEPDLLQNVKRVNPWLVEVVSNLPSIHLFPFSPPHKKLRLPPPPDFPLDTQIPFLPFTAAHHLLGSSPGGMQGARHGQYGISLSDLHFTKLRSSSSSSSFSFPFPSNPRPRSRVPEPSGASEPSCEENVSCLLSIGSSARGLTNRKEASFVLFGREILTEKEISASCSSDIAWGDERSSCEWSQSDLETGHCKVFMESEDVGRTLDLSLLESYDELRKKLASMFQVKSSEISNHIIYRDVAGVLKQLGEEPFSMFSKCARRLRVVVDSSSDNVGV